MKGDEIVLFVLLCCGEQMLRRFGLSVGSRMMFPISSTASLFPCHMGCEESKKAACWFEALLDCKHRKGLVLECG